MNKLLLLVKINALEMTGWNKWRHANTKKEKIRAGVTLFGLLALFIYVMFTSLMSNMLLKDVLVAQNAERLLLVNGSLTGFLLCLFLSIYRAPAYLFRFKDFNLLMSLPIKARDILLSKLILMYINNLLFLLIFSLPSFIVYGIIKQESLLYYFLLLLVLLVLPLLPLAIGALAGLFLGKIASKFKGSQIILLLGSFLLVGGISAGSIMLSTMTPERVTSLTNMLNGLQQKIFLLDWLLLALIDKNILAILGILLITVIPFYAFAEVAGRYFQQINNILQEGAGSTAVYKKKSMKRGSMLRALYKKELRNYFSSYIYVFNTGFGAVLMFAFYLAVAIGGRSIVKKILGMQVPDALFVGALLAASAAFMALSAITAPSISLEGKAINILQSLPIPARVVFTGKLALQLTITVPPIIFSWLITTFVLRFGIWESVLLFFLPLSYTLLNGVAGLIINLYFPKLEWQSEVTVVKQSMSAFLGVMFGLAAYGVPVIIFINLQPLPLLAYASLVTGAVLLLASLGYFWLSTKGERMFKELEG